MDKQDGDRSTGDTSTTQRWSVVDIGKVSCRIEQLESSAGDLRIEVQDRRLDRRLHRLINALNGVLVGISNWNSSRIATVGNTDVFEFESYGVGAIGDAEVITVLGIAASGCQIAVKNIDCRVR